MNKIIGIVGTPFNKTKEVIEGYEGLTTGTRTTYEKAVTKANGISIILTPSSDPNTIKKQLSLCDGLLMQGGSASDIEKMHIEYIKQWLKNDKPLLGICMGMQLTNVAMKGTLSPVKTGVNHAQKTPLYEPYHKINITKNNILYKMFGSEAMVNSNHIHHINKLAKGIEIIALSEDGVIEAIQVKNKKFAIGVEWHPEHLLKKDERWLMLFKEFVDAC